ncbi:hypothetical protein XELAEV_18002696mg, partial [Xenopus laevis]
FLFFFSSFRGKCSVTLLNETESLKSYLEREDFFFYSLVYDPQQKTLLADKGEIRVGNRYQADITDLLEEGAEDGRDQLPWKSLTSIIEYYYMWKTTDRYVQQINVNNVKPAVVNGAAVQAQNVAVGRACESCYTTQSYQWYSWGPPNMQCRLCASCWAYWKKYGGLKMPTRLDGERPGPNRNNMSPHGVPMRNSGSPKFAMKTRQAFYLQTTKLTKIARRLCRDIFHPRYAARHPYMPINSAAIKAECTTRLPEASKTPLVLKQVVRKPLEEVVRYIEAHPCPPKPDVIKNISTSINNSLTPTKSSPVINNGSPTILGKRSYEQHNGMDDCYRDRSANRDVRRNAMDESRTSPYLACRKENLMKQIKQDGERKWSTF